MSVKHLMSILISTLLIVSVLSSDPFVASTIVTERQLTSSHLHHEVPKIWGNITICEVFPTDYGPNPNIYIIDLRNSSETPANITDHFQINEDISGNRIVWQDNHGTSDICVYDLSTSTNTRITSKGSIVGWPTISGDIIAYQKKIGDRWQICYYNLSTSIEVQVTYNDVDHWDPPSVGGNLIAYTEENSGGNNIFIYNVTDRKITQLTRDGHSGNPRINEGRVLYGVYDKEGNDILYLQDLSSNQTIRVAPDRSRHVGVCFYGDLVVYQGYDGGSSDIYAYRISTSTETRVSTSGTAVNPAVYENRIVWQDYRDGQEEIYMAELIYLKPSASAPAPNLNLVVMVMLSGPAVVVILLWIAYKKSVPRVECAK